MQDPNPTTPVPNKLVPPARTGAARRIVGSRRLPGRRDFRFSRKCGRVRQATRARGGAAARRGVGGRPGTRDGSHRRRGAAIGATTTAGPRRVLHAHQENENPPGTRPGSNQRRGAGWRAVSPTATGRPHNVRDATEPPENPQQEGKRGETPALFAAFWLPAVPCCDRRRAVSRAWEVVGAGEATTLACIGRNARSIDIRYGV